MNKAKIVRNLTELNLLYLADKYYSASDYLRNELKMSENGRYIKIISDKMRKFDIEWLQQSITQEIICPVCKNIFITSISRPNTTCSVGCANTFFRSGKNNPNYKGGSYRKNALKYYGSICNRCNYNIERALIVHHKDRNRSNNNINNLEVLCANCHLLEHYS